METVPAPVLGLEDVVIRVSSVWASVLVSIAEVLRKSSV